MGVDTAETPKANGLKTALDMIIAPKEAFESLRVAPTWGWAYLITTVLLAVGLYLMTPALIHATQAQWPAQVAADPRLSAMTPEQQASGLNISLTVLKFVWLFAIVQVPIILLISTVVLLVFKAIGKGEAGFGKIWALVTNTAVPSVGLGAIVLGVLCMVRGADSFDSSISVSTAIPSLGMIAGGMGPKLHAFFAFFTPFTIWALCLNALGLIAIARVSKGVAWSGAIVLALIGAAFTAMGAR